MATVDREALKAWYRNALRGRVEALEVLRPGLARGDGEARAAVAAVGHALRGSGGTFGFPEVSEAGRLLEEAPPESAVRRVESVIHLLRTRAWPDEPGARGGHAWLTNAVGLAPLPSATLDEAWQQAAKELGVTPGEVAARAAGALGVLPPEPLRPTPGALRLVPERLVREREILPLDEDGRVIRVATGDPVDLATEAELQRVTGRTTSWVLVPPSDLRAALALAFREEPSLVGGSYQPVPPDPTGTPVLLVDDDAGLRLLARSVLERRGHPVFEAADGAEAMAILAGSREIALVVVDLEMPGMGGRELVRELRASPAGQGVGIIVLTGSEDPATEADLMEGGADDYLQKPLDPRLFLARVAATLRRSGWRPGTGAAPGAPAPGSG